jgi:alkylhydroperoxidase family enzyme
VSIPDLGGSSCFDEIERAVLFYTNDLMLPRGRVLDSTFAVLKKHLTGEKILELTYTTLHL